MDLLAGAGPLRELQLGRRGRQRLDLDQCQVAQRVGVDHPAADGADVPLVMAALGEELAGPGSGKEHLDRLPPAHNVLAGHQQLAGAVHHPGAAKVGSALEGDAYPGGGRTARS